MFVELIYHGFDNLVKDGIIEQAVANNVLKLFTWYNFGTHTTFTLIISFNVRP